LVTLRAVPASLSEMAAALPYPALRGGTRAPSMDDRWRRTAPWLAVPAGFAVSCIPFTNLAARLFRGVDLRDVGTGTVSGTALYQVAGFGPLAAAGVLEVAKGAVGPLLAGAAHPALRATAAGASIVGHDWSPLLGGAGGRGLSPAIGALGVAAPLGAAMILAGMAGGRLAGETAVGSLAATVGAVPVVRRVHGGPAAWSAAAVVAPMIVKRLAGNHRPASSSPAVYLWRLLLDRDSRKASSIAAAA
jgi:glycerol-3-phosphate acyltransferase PlsY